jgi:hypothetical protein
MSHEIVTAWIFSLMTALSPPDKNRVSYAQESLEDATARYQDIAESIVRNVYDPNIKPAFGGSKGRLQTALLLTMTFNWESGFRRDVDMGLARGITAKKGLNDFGRSWCMGQINLGRMSKIDPENPNESIENSVKTTPEGWTGRDLVEDHDKCVITTIRMLRSSLGDCKERPLEERLVTYITGKCDSEEGAALSRTRMSAVFARGAKMPNVNDSSVLKSMKAEQEDQEEQSSIGSYTDMGRLAVGNK